MDRKIDKKFWTLKRVATYGGITVLVVFVGYQFIFADRRQKLKVEKDKITISEVQRGEFKEFIPQTGIVAPARTVYLDAIEGGNIKRVVSESGAMLKQGDVILELTNLNRELAVLQQESQLKVSTVRGTHAWGSRKTMWISVPTLPRSIISWPSWSQSIKERNSCSKKS
jgi:HlyD family secretion protein